MPLEKQQEKENERSWKHWEKEIEGGGEKMNKKEREKNDSKGVGGGGGKVGPR